jgi:hypothetical protein
MNEPMESTGAVRSAEAIVTDLILLTFAGAIVVSAFSLVSEDARLVPLLFGVPTLAALSLQLLFDVFPARGRRFLRLPSGVGGGSGGGLAELEVDVDEDALTGSRATKRKFAFGGWVIGFAVLSYVTSFLISVPVALVFFYRYMAGQTWLRSTVIAGCAWLFVYAVFGLALDVPF